MLQKFASIFLLILFLLLGAIESKAQILKGKILRNGEPVALVGVKKKKKSLISTSDVHGDFVIKAKAGELLFIHQADTTWTVIATPSITIDLNELEGQFKTDRIKDTTLISYPNTWGNSIGATSQLDKTAFNQGNIFDPYGLIDGQVPGLIATHPGGDPLAQYDVQIRGLHTFSSMDYNLPPFDFNQEDPQESVIDRSRPLVVIDGFPGASSLGIDPAAITSIKVLRDAASAAAYGLRGANGVIEIETKRNINQPLAVSFNTYLAQDRAINLPDVLTVDEYRRRINSPDSSPYQRGLDLGNNTDWQKAITRTAWSHAHHLGIGGALKKTQYHVSLTYRDQQGIAQKSGFDQWNAQLQLQQQLWKDRLKVGINAGHTERNFQDIDQLIFRQSSIYNPTAPIYDDTSRFGGYHQTSAFLYNNPVAMLEQGTRQGSNQVSTLNANFSLTPIKGLSLSGRYAFQRSDDLYGLAYPRDAYFGGQYWEGVAERDKRRQDHQFTDLIVDYQLDWKKHALGLGGGYTYQQWDFTMDRIRATKFPNNDFSYQKLEGAAETDGFTFRSRDKMTALFGNLDYNWNDTWFFNAHLRREGASRMGPEHKWAWFPAIQTALSLHKVLDWENRFHFRLGYGEAGQLPPKNYAAHWNVTQTGVLYYDGAYVPSYDFYNTPNPAIGEERRSEWNVGLDIGLIRNRFTLSLDWYDSRTDGIVRATQLPVPPNTQSLFYENYGALGNRGLEINLGGKVLENSLLQWNSRLQVTHNTTRLISLTSTRAERPFDERRLGTVGFPGLCCTRVQLLEEGKAIGTFNGPVFKTIDTEGQWVFINTSGSTYDQDRRDLGHAQPDFNFGWHNDLRFGRFDMNFLLRGTIGHQMINTHQLFYGSPGQLGYYNVLSSSIEGDISRLTDAPQWSSYYLENASFIRLEYLSLGYHFQFKSKASISGLRLYLTAQHLFTISAYSGPDPSLRLENLGDPLAPGIDGPNGSNSARGFYFPNRTLLLGLSMQL